MTSDQGTPPGTPDQEGEVVLTADGAEPGASTELTNTGVDRGVVIGEWLRHSALWSLWLIMIGLGLWLGLWLLGKVWVGVLPIILALLVTTVLWPPVAWMRRHGVPSALASVTALLGSFALIGGIFAAIAPSVISQSADLIDRAAEGIATVQKWLSGPPVNLRNDQIDQATEEATAWLQGSSTQIAGGVFTTVGAVTSAMVTLVLVLVLTFFFLKDGPAFLPWVRQISGRRAGRHLTEVCTRIWVTLSGFIRTQALVSAVDAVFIGIGLLVLQVPLALAIAVLTFFGGFVPIVGAFAVGTLAVLVALVSNGWTTALLVLALIVVVQQVEGNVLQPFLQGRSMQLHAGIILLAVAAGSTIFGIIGAFLAVPVAASISTALRYASEQVDLRTRDLAATQTEPLTPEGAMANLHAAREAALWEDRARSTPLTEDEPGGDTEVAQLGDADRPRTADHPSGDSPTPGRDDVSLNRLVGRFKSFFGR